MGGRRFVTSALPDIRGTFSDRLVPDLWAYGVRWRVLPVLAEAWVKHWKATLGTEEPKWTPELRGE